MRCLSGSLIWTIVFASGLLLRPVLIVPMAPSGPLAGSALLPIGLASVFAFHVMLAAAVLVANRLAIGFAIFTAGAGVVLAVVGVIVGLPEPWPLLLIGLNLALAPIGVETWRRLPASC
jgi:hypothetical protein